MSNSSTPPEGVPADPQDAGKGSVHTDTSTEDNTATGAADGTDAAYGKSYDENPVDDAALREAAESIPVKDYSDYEIEIETKTEFADALFSSDEDLDSALEATNEAAGQTADTAPAEPPAESVSADPNAPRTYDFSPFMESGTAIMVGDLNRSPVATELPQPTALVPDQALVEEARAAADSEPEAPSQQPEKEPTSFAEKLKAKAKQQFNKSKAHFDEYTGRSLPEREMPLEFAFPVQKSKKEFDSIASGYSIKKLFEDKGKSILSVFRQADSDLAKINKCQMMASSRHSLLDSYAVPLIQKATEAIHSFERKPQLGGDGKRLQLADHCESAFKHLVNGYKQVYAHYYESANVVYAPQRHSANAVLSRLIEILLIEARICFALHTQVPAGSIKAMNKLFTAARLYEPQLLTAPYVTLFDGGTTSIKAMYFHFQTLLVLDGCNLSPLLYRVFHPYLTEKLGLMSLRDAPDAGQQQWVLGHEHSSPPRLLALTPEGGDQVAPTIIDVTRFLAAIKADYAELMAHRDEPAWKPADRQLAGIKRHYALSFMASLNQQVLQHEQSRPAPSFSIYQPARIRSYSGLSAIIAHLHFSYEKATRKPERPGETVTDLPEKPKADKAQWHRAQQEADCDYLQVAEEKALAQLDIGQPLLLLEIVTPTGDGDDSARNKQPEQLPESVTLGLITHANRLPGHKLNLTVCLLGHEVTHATLKLPDSDGKQVLLLHTPQGLALLTDYMTPIPTACAVTLPDGSERSIRVGAPLWQTPKCQLLAVQ